MPNERPSMFNCPACGTRLWEVDLRLMKCCYCGSPLSSEPAVPAPSMCEPMSSKFETYQTPDGTYWCANAHYWRKGGVEPAAAPVSTFDFDAVAYVLQAGLSELTKQHYPEPFLEQFKLAIAACRAGRASLSGSARPTKVLPCEIDLLATDDAMVWAKEFIRMFDNARDQIDVGLMVSWFANAICVGEDHYKRRLAEGDAGTQPWISVKERLPEDGVQVLTAQTRANGERIIRTSHHYAFDMSWYVEDQSFMTQPIVTHWMPLPEPPVSGDKEKQ